MQQGLVYFVGDRPGLDQFAALSAKERQRARIPRRRIILRNGDDAVEVGDRDDQLMLGQVKRSTQRRRHGRRHPPLDPVGGLVHEFEVTARRFEQSRREIGVRRQETAGMETLKCVRDAQITDAECPLKVRKRRLEHRADTRSGEVFGLPHLRAHARFKIEVPQHARRG